MFGQIQYSLSIGCILIEPSHVKVLEVTIATIPLTVREKTSTLAPAITFISLLRKLKMNQLISDFSTM